MATASALWDSIELKGLRFSHAAKRLLAFAAPIASRRSVSKARVSEMSPRMMRIMSGKLQAKIERDLEAGVFQA